MLNMDVIHGSRPVVRQRTLFSTNIHLTGAVYTQTGSLVCPIQVRLILV